jgi:hypothetical protein
MGLLDPNPPLEHFLNTNPKDLFFKDPKKRVLKIDHQKFLELSESASQKFHRHNSNLFNLIRRGFARRRAYMYDPALLKRDFGRGLEFLGLGSLLK